MNTVVEKVINRSVTTLKDITGKRIFLRIDVNTSLGKNAVVDPSESLRITSSYETIRYLSSKGAMVIVASHQGSDPGESLRPVYDFMSRDLTLGFIPRFDADLIANTLDNMGQGAVVMLENLRQDPKEISNDSSFLDAIIEQCDYYVNDAFAVSHRAHASVNDIASKLPSYFGLQFCREVSQLARTLEVMKQGTAVLVLGGAKFGTKLDLLRRLLPEISYALVGGALANVFLRERGFEIGKSFADDVDISDMLTHEKIILPVDAIDQHGDIIPIDTVTAEDMILDIGPETEALFEQIIDHASGILWNGPMGKYEDGYVSGSLSVADSIAKSTAFSVVGGGDIATVIIQEGLLDSFDFVSTGGGAMLEFLLEGTLPGIDAIIENKKQ